MGPPEQTETERRIHTIRRESAKSLSLRNQARRKQESLSVKWMQPTQPWCPGASWRWSQPPSQSSPRPPAHRRLTNAALPERQKKIKKKKALTSSTPPSPRLHRQTSGGYYSPAHAAKHHFHNETSHFSAPASVARLFQCATVTPVASFWLRVSSAPPT